jgi:hypothetical protein
MTTGIGNIRLSSLTISRNVEGSDNGALRYIVAHVAEKLLTYSSSFREGGFI